MNIFYNPVRTYQGRQCINNLHSVISSIPKKCETILILTWDQSFINTDKYRDIENQLKDYNLKIVNYSLSNPDISHLYEIYVDTKDWNIDLVIAIGGGSVLDIGKSLCCLYGQEISSKEDLRKIIIEKKLSDRLECSWIGIPTTFGTGSEVTCWATIWDRENGSKLSLENIQNYAYAVFVDSEFAQSMPIKLVVSSGLDALAHAIEAYWSKSSNTTSKIYALKAISILMENIPNIIKYPENIDYQENMAKGSLLAGLAFSNTKTTACHAISYPLTLNYGIAHGVAVSMLIAPVMKINIQAIEDKEELFNALKVKDVGELNDKILNLLKEVKIPCSLSNWEDDKEKIRNLADQCFTKGRIDNNPVKLTKDTIVSILETIY